MHLLLFRLLIGHEYYVDTVKKKKLFKLHPRDVPWSTRPIGEQEFAKIMGIEFETKSSTTLICLKVIVIYSELLYLLLFLCNSTFFPLQLNRVDPANGKLTGQYFTLKYHYVADICDILVLRQNYDLALQRNWQPGDRFRAIIGDSWWEGHLEARKPLSAECPNSMFLCFRIRYLLFSFSLFVSTNC